MKPMWLLSLLLIFSPLWLAHGDEPPLVTDRPDFTESATSVAVGSWQFEFGYTYEKNDEAKDHTVGELLVRFTLIDKLEFRLGVNSFRIAEYGGVRFDGLEDMDLGFKYALAPDKVAVIVSTSVPTGASAFRVSKLQPTVVLALARDVSDTVSLGVNLGYTRASDGDVSIDEFSASAAAGIGLTDKLGLFVEYFGFYYSKDDGENQHFADAGLTYLVNPTFQLDIRAGRILNKGESTFFIGIGAVKRF